MNPLSTVASAPALHVDHTLPARVLNKIAWRLIPFLGLLYIVNILDRSNAGFARLTLEKDLGISPEAFDIAYGLFYIGYLLFEVPANLLLRRIGARLWMARIMVSWGLVTCATAAVTGLWGFSTMRILLGIAEAGFFPGIILYLTYWVPSRERARMMALFIAASPLAGVVGNPLSGAIMQYLDGFAHLAGWQWIFLIEGFLAVVIGLAVLYVLKDGPAQAHWLAPEERTWLIEQLKHEEHTRQQRHGGDLLRALVDGRVWLLICVYSTVAVGSNAAGAYFPKLVKARFAGCTTFEIGLLTALPYLFAVVGMTYLAARSDRTGQRRGHVAFSALLGAAGWAVAMVADEPWLALAGFCVAQAGMMSMLPCFWALPTSFLSGAAAAGGIALINSVGNIGGFLGPAILGQWGLAAMALTLVAGGLLTLLVRHERNAD